MKNTSPKISIVIPAYNEQDQIAACLEAIAKLNVRPFEVIIVDNGCEDRTVEIAKNFSFAKIVKEPKRGLVYARDTGFNTARGDIIGRIDADTLLPVDWTEKLIDIFSNQSIKAVTGGLHFYDIGFSQLIDRIDAFWRSWMARRMEPNSRVFLLGANMAIRKSSWQKVRRQLCHEKGFHEDLDLALHLSKASQKVVLDLSLIANVSARRIDSSLLEIIKYAFENPWVYLKHKAKEHIYMYPLIVIVILSYLFLRVVFRAFDQQSQKLKFKQLIFRPSAARINPTDIV